MMHWTLATEDELSEAVGLRLFSELPVPIPEPNLFRRNGFGYLKARISTWRSLARHQVVVVITDLDRKSCPPALLEDWLGQVSLPENMLLRVAVREVESWLLADHQGLQELLGRRGKFPRDPDLLPDPKQYLLAVAKRSDKKDIRRDLVREDGAAACQGLGYNSRLSSWVGAGWSPERAASRSPSLQRARQRLLELAVRLRW